MSYAVVAGLGLLPCSGFSLCGLWLKAHGASVAVAMGPAGLDPQALQHRLSGCVACRIFLDPGFEPVSLVLAGRFFTTVDHQGSPEPLFLIAENIELKILERQWSLDSQVASAMCLSKLQIFPTQGLKF